MQLGAMALLLVGTLAADYAGVVPGRPPPKKNDGPKSMVTWVGFQIVEGKPRVFVQTSSPPTFQQRAAGNEVIVTIPGFRVNTKNNTRPLKTADFGTDILSVVAKPTTAGVDVHVRFRGPARPAKISTADDSEGWSYLYLDF